MAGKVQVHEVKVKNGQRQVLTHGGWVPWSVMSDGRKNQVSSFLKGAMDERTFAAWSAVDQDFHWVAGGAALPVSSGNVPQQGAGQGADPVSGDPSQGKGDPSQSQGSSQGAGSPWPPSGDPNEYVTHDEFDPWASQVDASLKDHAEFVVELFKESERHELAINAQAKELTHQAQDAAELRKRVDRLANKVENVSNGNTVGTGAGVIVTVNITRPNVPAIQADGVFHHQFPMLTRLVAAGQNVYLPGPPGTGKSHSAKAVSEVLGWRFGSISLGPTTPESRLWGGKDANGNFHEPTFVELARFAQDNPDHGAVFCMDEMDNGHPGIIATLNSAMANGWFTAPNGDDISWGNNFVIVAGANTYGTGPTEEFAGRNRLDAATLDRFAYLPYDTDVELEATLVRSFLVETPSVADDWLDCWHSARANVAAHGLKVFVTMRGAINGAKMIGGGLSIYEAMDLVLLNKLPKDQADKVNPL